MTNLVGDASVLSALREDQQHPAAATTKQPHAGEKRRRCERRMKAAKRSAIPCKQSSAAIGELVIVLQSCRTRAIQQRPNAGDQSVAAFCAATMHEYALAAICKEAIKKMESQP